MGCRFARFRSGNEKIYEIVLLLRGEQIEKWCLSLLLVERRQLNAPLIDFSIAATDRGGRRRRRAQYSWNEWIFRILVVSVALPTCRSRDRDSGGAASGLTTETCVVFAAHIWAFRNDQVMWIGLRLRPKVSVNIHVNATHRNIIVYIEFMFLLFLSSSTLSFASRILLVS